MTITWKIKTFDELTTKELYALLNLRIQVFSVEQNVPYQDLDGKDFKSFHLSGYDDRGDLVAYARILPAGIVYKEASIGRVVSSAKARGTGTGKELMKNAMKFVEDKFGNIPIRISAQFYLVKFYQSYGFKVIGEQYLEDNLPHIEMLKD